MIVPETRQLVFNTIRYVGKSLLLLLAYDVAVVLAYKHGYLRWPALEQIPLSLFGSAVGVLLAFRNTSSYARWWEARMLWGSIVNNSRSWARQVTTVMRGSEGLGPAQRRMVYYQIAWVHGRHEPGADQQHQPGPLTSPLKRRTARVESGGWRPDFIRSPLASLDSRSMYATNSRDSGCGSAGFGRDGSGRRAGSDKPAGSGQGQGPDSGSGEALE